MSPIRLAVVDDSAFVRKAIRRLLEEDPRIEVVGAASSGEELLAHLEEWLPDAITLDLTMPGMGGLPTLDRIMQLRPTPVIILSTHAGRGAPQTIEALHRGAADFIDKQQYSLLDFHALHDVLVEKVTAVIRPRAAAGQSRARATGAVEAAAPEPPPAPPPPSGVRCRLLLVGASTGGPPAIQQLLSGLGADWPAPVLVVQHMPRGFTRAFADRLNVHLPFEVREAAHGVLLVAGTVLIAPAGHHLRVAESDGRLTAVLDEEPAEVAHRPSVDELFSSVADVVGGEVAAVLLTGMGRDGAEGLATLARAGAFTVAQDRRSSVVYGMPGAAVALGAAREVLALEAIAPRLREVVETPPGRDAEERRAPR